MTLDIVLFMARTAFLVLIYVFIFILLLYLIRDLQRTGTGQNNEAGSVSVSVGANAVVRPSSMGNKVGALRVEFAPEEYKIQGVEVALTDEIRMGRDLDNDVVLPGGFVSGQHARLYLQNGQYWLEDLGSKNGTLLNGVPISGSTVLASGDQIAIGDITLRFVRWGYEVESDHRVRPSASEK